jgi:hypothetical protein
MTIIGPAAQPPQRPRDRAAEQHDELAALYSITSSARASSDGGTSRPRAFAVFRFTSNSTLVTCCTGRSVGLSPLRIRPAYAPTRRYCSVRLPP